MNVLITGASKGLGFEIAKRFVSEGHNITICSRSFEEIEKVAEKLEQFKRNDDQAILYSRSDVSDEQSARSLVEGAIEMFGRIDVLVNNAGVYGPLGKIEDVDAEEWKKAIEINLMGPFYTMQSIIPHMKENSRGKIINLSGGGATSPLPNVSAYAASKTAIVRLTESIALECKDYNIDINSIAPGLLDTRLFDEIVEAGPNIVGKEFYDKLTNQEKTPLDVGVELCYWLSTKESDGITGKLISAKWDPKNLHEYRDELNNSDIYTLRRIVPKDRNKNWS